MSSFNYDHVFVTWRKGTVVDPYIDITDDAFTVVNGRYVLREIPVEYNHVFIEGLSEVKTTLLQAGQFYCDYTSGSLTFYTAQEGLPFVASYKGRGVIKYSASRIVSHNATTGAMDNLQEIIDNGQAGIDALTHLPTVTANAQVATTSASSYRWKNTWDNATAYVVNEMVNYQGTAYICTQANTNQIPAFGSTFWSVFAEKGSSVNPIVDDSMTIRNSTDTSKNMKIQLGVSGGIEFVIGG